MYDLIGIIFCKTTKENIFWYDVDFRNQKYCFGNIKKFHNFSFKKCDKNILDIKMYSKIFKILCLLLEIHSQEA